MNQNYNISLNRRQYIYSLIILGFLGTISLVSGIRTAIIRNSDFQISSSRLFTKGENPYLYFLDGNINSELLAPPNYLHQLYALMAPLTIFNDETSRLLWAIINTALAIWCCIELCKLANRTSFFWLIFLFFLMSLPFRNGLGNNQNQILLLTFFILSMKARQSKTIGFFGALTFLKYSFSGSWIGMNIRRNLKSVIWSGLFTIFFIGIGAFWISSGDIMIDIFGPMLVSKDNVSEGFSDIFTITTSLFGSQYKFLLAIFLLILNIFIVDRILKNSKDILFILAIGGVTSLMFLPHLIYDGVFLLPALIFLISRGGIASLLGVSIIIYNWQVLKILYILGLDDSIALSIFHLFAYITLLKCLIISEKKNFKPLLNIIS